MRLIIAAIFIFFASSAYAQNAAPSRKFVPGDLIVGYKSADDKKAALEDFKSQNSSARGLDEEGGGVQAEELSGKALKLHFDLPPSSARGLDEGDQSELGTLQDLAKNLKANDKRIEYAHPNWIMKLDPIENTSPNPKAKLQSLQANSYRPKKPDPGPNDPVFTMGLQWNLLPPPIGMNAVGAWKIVANSKASKESKVVVAVLDSGIVTNQPDIADQGHLLSGYNFVSHDLCEYKIILRDNDVSDTGNYCGSPNSGGSEWHGTHVAGIIGAAGTNNGEGIASIAWNIAVLPVRVIGSGGAATDDIVDAIRWAAGLHVDGVPDNDTPADVINMSLGGRIVCDEENFAALTSAIADARNAGAVIVASAGNGAYVTDDGEECTPAPGYDACKFRQEDVKGYEPAGCPGVISVAASDPHGHIAFYSNYGNVTIMAPGGDESMSAEFPDGNTKTARPLGVWSTIRDGYGSMEGTSQAAPHVSAAIALALATHPAWRHNPDLVERKLRETAFKPKAGACPDDTPCGAGQLDAQALLAAR